VFCFILGQPLLQWHPGQVREELLDECSQQPAEWKPADVSGPESGALASSTRQAFIRPVLRDPFWTAGKTKRNQGNRSVQVLSNCVHKVITKSTCKSMQACSSLLSW